MREVIQIATTILIALGGAGAIILSLSGYLGRIWAERLMGRERHAHERDLEALRSELAARTTWEVEQFRATLQLAAVEHEVRFSRLHEKRAQVLAELYKLLVEATWQASSLANPFQFVGDPDKPTLYVAAMNAIAAYYRFFDQHRIWIPAALCEPLETFAKKLRTPAVKVGVYVEIEHPTAETKKETLEALGKAWESVQTEIPVLRAAIEAEFRTLLGAAEAKAG
jgi:hypothetical protein